MDHVLTNFWRVLIILISIYLIYFINKGSIKNINQFVKRFLFWLLLSVTCSIIIIIGTIYNFFMFNLLNNNTDTAIKYILSLKSIVPVNLIDSILFFIIPTILISVYSYYANNFKQSFYRSSCASIIVFLMTEIILIILEIESPYSINSLIYGLFHDIIGGILFGFIISLVILLYKRMLIDSSFDRNVKLIKYYKLILTIVLGSIFIYFMFFYRTYNSFSLTLSDYDLFRFQFNTVNADKNVKVVIPTTGIFFGYESDFPFLIDWDYKDRDIVDKRTNILVGTLNIENWGEIFKDHKKLSELLRKPTKDVVNVIFNFLISKTIEPGEIRVAGDKSSVYLNELKGENEIIFEITLPINKDINIIKDIAKYPHITKKHKEIFEKAYTHLYHGKKILSVITFSDKIFDAKIINTKELLLCILDTKEQKSEMNQYIINLPLHDGEIRVPLITNNNIFLVIGDGENGKDIRLHNIPLGCCFEIDANSLIANIFKNHKINDILMTNIKGKLHYIDKEIYYNKGDILSIDGKNLSIGQITEDTLTITGQSKNIMVNNQELGRTVYSSLSGGIQILSGIIIMVFGILTFYYSFVVSDKKSKRSKKGSKCKRK